MITSKIWDKKWADARAQGIDGFTVGFKPGTHPGAIHWERYCNMCKTIMEYDVSPSSNGLSIDFCENCTKKIEELTVPMEATVDIKTSTGQPLEGFPFTHQVDRILKDNVYGILSDIRLALADAQNLTLHPGYTITIKIEEKT